MPESIDSAAEKADGRGGNVDHTGRKEAARHPMGWADDVDEFGVGAVRLQEAGKTTSHADAKDVAELLGGCDDGWRDVRPDDQVHFMADRDAADDLAVDADGDLTRLHRTSELPATGESTCTVSLLEEVEQAFAQGKSTVLGAADEAGLYCPDCGFCESHRFGAELFVLVERSREFFNVEGKGFEPQFLPQAVKNQLCQFLRVAEAADPHSPATYAFRLAFAPESERLG